MNLSDRAQDRLSQIGLEFLVELLAVETERHPDNLEALAELGHSLTRLGRYDEGLEIDLELVRRAPRNSTVYYNLACSLALLGRSAQSLDALERAVELGYDDAEHLALDQDLATLHGEGRFAAILHRLRTQAPV